MKKLLQGKYLIIPGILVICLILTVIALFLLRWVWGMEPVQARLAEWWVIVQPCFSTKLTPAPTLASQRPTEALLAEIVISRPEITEESQDPRYSINARWPYVEWNGDLRVDLFNQIVENIVMDEIRSFKESVFDLPDDTETAGYSSSLNIDYTLTNTIDGILSILLRTSYYGAGAAHPGSYSYAVNYDLHNGNELGLEDLFLPGVNYLEPISTYCIDNLKARDVLAWEDGASPQAENYRVWNITPEGLQITFDEYQVAPYAAGPQVVIVPYKFLKDIAQPEGPLSSFLSREY